jgi:hypothetical protein
MLSFPTLIRRVGTNALFGAVHCLWLWTQSLIHVVIFLNWSFDLGSEQMLRVSKGHCACFISTFQLAGYQSLVGMYSPGENICTCWPSQYGSWIRKHSWMSRPFFPQWTRHTLVSSFLSVSCSNDSLMRSQKEQSGVRSDSFAKFRKSECGWSSPRGFKLNEQVLQPSSYSKIVREFCCRRFKQVWIVFLKLWSRILERTIDLICGYCSVWRLSYVHSQWLEHSRTLSLQMPWWGLLITFHGWSKVECQAARLSPQLYLVLVIVMAGTSIHVSDKQRCKWLSLAQVTTKCKTDRTIAGKKTFNLGWSCRRAQRVGYAVKTSGSAPRERLHCIE